jgi:Tfp pilus assembly protein PilP
MMRSILLAVTAPLLLGTVLLAQAPAPAAGAAAVPKPAPPAAEAPPPPPLEIYTYESDGRRDPFLNLMNTGADLVTPGRRGPGPGGMTVSEISVRGIMESRGLLVAMIAGPDNKTYIVHKGDKLLDGSIKSITPQGLVCVQEVNDPLSLVKQREVSKLLRSTESSKQ